MLYVADQDFAIRFGRQIGTLVEIAREVEVAWLIRGSLADDLHEQIVKGPVKMKRLLRNRPESEVCPISVVDGDCRFVAANEKFSRMTGRTPGTINGSPCTTVTDPDHRIAARTNFGRLESGELDFLDARTSRVGAGGVMLDCVSHSVAVRRLDATLQCVITVDRPLHPQAA